MMASWRFSFSYFAFAFSCNSCLSTYDNHVIASQARHTKENALEYFFVIVEIMHIFFYW